GGQVQRQRPCAQQVAGGERQPYAHIAVIPQGEVEREVLQGRHHRSITQGSSAGRTDENAVEQPARHAQQRDGGGKGEEARGFCLHRRIGGDKGNQVFAQRHEQQ